MRTGAFWEWVSETWVLGGVERIEHCGIWNTLIATVTYLKYDFASVCMRYLQCARKQ